jgi:hypothetical protein
MYILQVLAPRRHVSRDVAAVPAGAAPVLVPGLTTLGDPADSQSMSTELITRNRNRFRYTVRSEHRKSLLVICELK